MVRDSVLGVACATVLIAAWGSDAAADAQVECSTSASSQVETSDCMDVVHKNAQSAVELALGFAMSSAKELDEVTGRTKAMPALETSQATWSKFQTSHCAFVGATFGGGSGTSIAIKNCEISLARDRYSELMQFTQ